MTRKDYIKLARAFNGALNSTEDPWFKDGVRACIERVTDELYQDNGRFDYGRFVEACESDAATIDN